MDRSQDKSTKSAEFIALQKAYVSGIFQEILPNANTKKKNSNAEDNYVSTDEESDCEATDLANLTRYLYTCFQHSLASGDHAQQIEILTFLVKKDLVDMELIKRMVAHHVALFPENAPELLKNLRNAQVPIQGAELDELFLLHMIHHIWLGQGQGKERFEEAAKAAEPNLDGLGRKKYTKATVERNQGSLACSRLRTAYNALLQYDAQFWAEQEGEAEMNFEQLILKLGEAFKSTRPYLHLFIKPYVFFLVQNEQQQKAEDFIKKYVQKEIKDRAASRGISPLLAYEIVLDYLPNASEDFHQKILEAVAEVDRGNAHVLKLCRIYQEMSSKKPSKSSDPLALTPSSRCLELLFYFLDQPDPYPLPPHFTEAWKILADVLVVVCKKRSDQEVKMLIELWYLNRRSWWPSNHFIMPPGFDESLPHKALVAFVLSDTGDKEKYASFTNDVISQKKDPNIESLIRELGPHQQKLRRRFQQLLPDMMRE